MASAGCTSLETALAGWFDAFNEHDLDGLIAGTSPNVRIYPLPLAGIEMLYRGHDGLSRWIEDLEEAEHMQRIAVSHFRAPRRNEVLAIGEVHFPDHANTIPFWARDRFEDGRIAVAHHYLCDPELGSFLLPT